MRALILFGIGTAIFIVAIVTAPIWFPYQLPLSIIGGGLIGISQEKVVGIVVNWIDQ